LFAGIDEGVDISECVEHPYLASTPFRNVVYHFEGDCVCTAIICNGLIEEEHREMNRLAGWFW
jgi:hypothetical protein